MCYRNHQEICRNVLCLNQPSIGRKLVPFESPQKMQAFKLCHYKIKWHLIDLIWICNFKLTSSKSRRNKNKFMGWGRRMRRSKKAKGRETQMKLWKWWTLCPQLRPQIEVLRGHLRGWLIKGHRLTVGKYIFHLYKKKLISTNSSEKNRSDFWSQWLQLFC